MDKNIQMNSFFENGVFQDFYQILEVSKDASEEEIKRNYRRLSKMYHPDTKTADEDKMKRIGIAYGVLKKPELKQFYDECYFKYKNGNSTKTTGSNYSYNTTNNRTYNNYTNNTSNAYTKSNNYSSSSTSRPYTENEIRDILRKNHYSEFKIEDFLYWCRKDNIKIYSMTGLSTYFSRYLWSKSEHTEAKKTSRSSNNTNTSYQQKTETPKKTVMSSVTSPSNSRELYELRKMLVRQMLLEQMVRYYYYQNMMYNISNLRFYTPIYSKVKFYQTPVYTSNINFYSILRRGYVYKFYR